MFNCYFRNIEEIKPMWGAGTQYDLYDILAGAIGSLAAIITFELLLLKKNKADKNILSSNIS